jgi:hypothetical protein
MSRHQAHLIGITYRCGASWSGEDRRHCAACRRTFDGIFLGTPTGPMIAASTQARSDWWRRRTTSGACGVPKVGEQV